MLRPNTILKGQYRIIRRIGRGGQGAVYEALDDELNALVALKETFAETDAQREAFEREAQLLANLEHEAFPKVMRHFYEGDGQYLVMELIRGNDLAELLKLRESPFGPDKVLEWADQLLDALEELHSYPIIHRDIKPSNLKRTNRGKVKLIDFGIAKGAAGQMTTVKTDRSGGGYTAHYAPLEQVLRSDVRWNEILRDVDAGRVERIQEKTTDPRSDLYALAATLYHLMTSLIPPPDAASRALSVWKGKPDRLLPAHKLNPLVSHAVSDVLIKAMALERDERPATAAEMRRMLREAVNEPLSTPPTQFLPELEEQSRRRQEAEALRRAEEEQARRRAEEEAQRVAAEEERQRLEAAASARRAEEDEQQQRREREDAERRELDAVRKRAEREWRQRRAAAEFERQRIDEENRREESERLTLEAEENERRRAAAQEQQQQPGAATAETIETTDGAPPGIVALKDEGAASGDDATAPVRREFLSATIRAWLLVGMTGLLLVLFFVLVLTLRRNKASEQVDNANESSVTQTSAEQTGASSSQTGAPAPPSGMVYVPGDDFTIGRDRINGGDEYESPAHFVTVKSFFIDQHEVTRMEYLSFITETRRRAPPDWVDGMYAAGDQNKPVTRVSWNDAKAYCEWAGKRLPTEQEWESAARGADRRLYPWGNKWQRGYANANGEQKGLVDVGRYRGVTPVGVVDMVGNAWEWTASRFEPYPGNELSPAKFTPDARVIRGGNYMSNERQATTTYRMGLLPTNDPSGYKTTGFRCVKDVD